MATIQSLKNTYLETNDKQFLIGLMSGYLNSIEILKLNEPNSKVIGQLSAIVIYISDKYLKL